MTDEIKSPLIADVEVRRQSEEWRRVLGKLEMALEDGEQILTDDTTKESIRAMRMAIRKVLEQDDG